MNLHRASRPDWETIPENERTTVQVVAASTRGVVTLANGITVLGLVLVIAGVVLLGKGDMWTGLLCIAIGRLLDVADGIVAEWTSTKSPLGEAADAIADKLGTFLVIGSLLAFELAPWWMIVVLFVPQVVIAGIILYLRRNGRNAHPTRFGKSSMALVWVSILGILGAVSSDGSVSGAWAIPISLVIMLSAVLACYAAFEYLTGRD